MVAITGATGLIGTALMTHLRSNGHAVRRITRSRQGAEASDVYWSPPEGVLAPSDLEGCDAIVHLAGAPIAQRWTSAHRREIRDSRVQGTTLIARTVAAMPAKPSVVVSGSAVGYYGDRGDEVLDESARSGSDFLAEVGREWEGAASPIIKEGVRLVWARTGIVLSPDGGALAKMLPPFRLGMGGPMGGGDQWMSWIALSDHVRAIEHALRTASLSGPVNFVAPNPVTNAMFASTLGEVLHRPAVIPLPALALELMFGEMARATILSGQRVVPKALGSSGFQFLHPELRGALVAELAM